VEDSVHYAKVLRRLLEHGLGYTNITHVERTFEAMELIQNEPDRFHVLFVDYNFPTGDNGGTFLESLKARNLIGNKVAFLITSEPSLDKLEQATRAGAVGVVAKPFDRQQLTQQIERAKRMLFAESQDYF
jgi:CheY-like chemotaxis protein